MRSEQEIAYRLKLAQGFLKEVDQDVSLQRWRSAVDNAQLAIENSAKSDIHLQTDYGNEAEGRTPWDLFGERDGRQALVMAKEAFSLAQTICQETGA